MLASAHPLTTSWKIGLFGACAVSIAIVAAAAPSRAMTIVPRFDSTITALSNAAAVEAAFKAVARDYSSSFNNPATVNVNVSWGSVAGQALPATAVGASVDNLYGYFTYAQVRNDLASFSAANPADTALATALRNMPTTAPTSGPSRYVIASAEAKALGLISPTQSSADASIGFAGSTSGYDFDPTNGVSAGTYDFAAVAAHELAEVLGRIGGISSTSPSWRTPLDLFRFSAPHVLDSGYNDAAYFSINGGVTDLKNFNKAPSGGDRTDWASTANVFDVSDAFIRTGTAYKLSAVDLTVLDVLGWGGSNLGDYGANTPGSTAFSLIDAAPGGVPEPSEWAIMILGFSLAGALLRGRRTLRPAPFPK